MEVSKGSKVDILTTRVEEEEDSITLELSEASKQLRLTVLPGA